MDSPHGSRALAVLALLAGFASTSSPAIAGCIPDNIPDDGYIGIGDGGDAFGADAGMLCCSEDVSTLVPGVIQDVNLVLGMTHSYVGDLVVKIKGPTPGNTISTVLSRPGVAEGLDDGSGDAGSAAGWNASAIRFDEQTSGPSAETLGVGLLSSDQVCIADGVCAFKPAHDSGPGNRLDTDFDGQSYVGVWQVCVGDGASPDSFPPVWNSYTLELVLDRSMPCVCNGKFRGGDHVRYGGIVGPESRSAARANLGAVGGEGGDPAPGTEGIVMCGETTFEDSVLVSWNEFATGHAGNDLCACPTGSLPAGDSTGWYVSCGSLALDLPWFDDFETGNTDHWTLAQGAL